jgi:hypothetical protein
MSFASNNESHTWWATLRHEGLLLDEERLRKVFPDDALPLSAWRADHLGKALITFQATPDDTAVRTALITALLEDAIGLGANCGGTWKRGSAVPPEFIHRSVTGEIIKPAHLFTHIACPPLPVFSSPDSRLGVGHGKRTAARVVEWMRAKQHRLAILTNGHQWRLIYAHGDSSAWCESDSSQWFVEGRPAEQLDAIRLLLDPRVLLDEAPDPEKPTSPLFSAIEASRRGQSELSAILGERVRQGVEKLIASHGPAFLAQADAPARQDIYVAACRIVLRLVFTLFAEARDLLPRSNPVYWQSYSLGGLLEQLLRVGAGSGRERLRHRFSAWPRLIALGRLVHAGSPHEALPLLPYGGELFSPGDAASTDGISRALAVFESACFDSTHEIMPDSEVLEVLTLITRTQTVIRQGRGRTTVTVPVDFSDLSSEYIGILYEGLLDYELRCVSEEEAAVLFLAIGNEPALPLARLEQMKDEDLKGLVDAFKKAAKAPAGEGEEESDDEPADDEEEAAGEEELLVDSPDAAEEESDEVAAEPETTHSLREAARQRALAWARRAVESSGLVPKPKRGRGRNPDAAADHEHRLAAAARSFTRRLILPGEWYLVRWGGTRKGSGSFYTRPGLALPTIRRTLEPLAYERSDTGALTPRSPQVILSLKTCDPSCGSGTFPVGTLRYLTEALFLSVFHHGWLVFDDERQADGSINKVIKPGPAATSQPVPAVLESMLREVRLRAIGDESRLRAWLKRLIVENCLYGVDLDPLAIELARLALWVETMDPTLPFTFLDHKFRCGNGLVGAWIDTFQHYPVMAWHREGGDKNHTNFHHHFREKLIERGKKKGQVEKLGDVWTEALKQRLDTVIRPTLRSFIEETTEPVFALLSALYEPNQLLDQALAAFTDIHSQVDDPAAQRAAYQQWLDSPHYRNLRTSLDLWCALWFWPADRLAAAPTPLNFSQPSEEALAIAGELHCTHRFFHWELEFPDVFGSGTRDAPAGFHALIGNPPWETIQPMSKEFFSNRDPLYRTYGNQVAVAKQTELFTNNRGVEHEWLCYLAQTKALAHFGKYTAFAFGDPQDHANDTFHFTIVPRRPADDARLHARWRPRRKSLASFADPAHPFRYQGEGKPYLQKLFTEQAHALLRPSGRLGFILPSGIYSDKGSATLRKLFLDQCRWEWCFGFENREKIFDIDRRFKFIALVVEKGGITATIHTAFMRRAVDDWDSHAESIALNYPRELVTKLSPFSTALVEIRDSRDVAILDRMYSRGVLLGDQSERGWGLRFQQGDFNMTSDSKLFPPLPKWEAQGYRPDEYGHWLKGDWRPTADFDLPVSDLPTHARATTITQRPGFVLSRDGTAAIRIEDIEDVAVPLYEGRMIGQFDFSQKGWVSGKGRTAVWRDIPWEEKQIEPQYLMGFGALYGERMHAHLQAIQAELGEEARLEEWQRLKAPDEWIRWWMGYSHKVTFMDIASATNERTMFATALDLAPAGHSAPLLTGLDHGAVLTALAVCNSVAYDSLLRMRVGGLHLTWHYLEETQWPVRPAIPKGAAHLVAALCLGHTRFASWWQKLSLPVESLPWQRRWAISPAERLRCQATLDAVVASIFGLSAENLRWLFVDCDHPRSEASSGAFTSRLDAKGFWRVDKEKDPELRHTVLAQVAYADLTAQGLEAFLTGPDGEGWQLPKTLRLADYGLGHDARAREPQPVASRFGPRFLDWQLAKDPAQSWAECKAHAAQLESLWRHARQLSGAPADEESAEETETLPAAAPRGKSERAREPHSAQSEWSF